MSTKTSLANLDPVLLRQLKKSGLADPTAIPSVESWIKLLSGINDYYRHVHDDRALLTRTIELSTNEMDELRRRLEGQRDQLKSVIDAISEALGLFGGIVDDDGAPSRDAGGLATAKRDFAMRLHDLFSEERQSESAQVSGIRTNLVRLADRMIRLLSETAERASIKKELEVARVVQSLLVPAETVIERAYVRIAGHYKPAAECGGDWWAVYDLPEDRVLTLIGDVTGHGISSAIITGAAKAACDLACHVTGGALSPSDLLRMMNQAIHETARRQIMMTCTASVFEPATGLLTVANAGHHFPYHLRGGQLGTIVVQGQPLGANANATYDSVTVQFKRGDAFVWFSDGVVECENETGELFSERRLRAVCQRAAPGGAVAVRDAVVEAVGAFQESKPQEDDMTLVVASLQ